LLQLEVLYLPPQLHQALLELLQLGLLLQAPRLPLLVQQLLEQLLLLARFFCNACISIHPSAATNETLTIFF